MSDDLCADCDRRPRLHGWNRCSDCLRAFVDGLNRRKAAELRLPPLDEASA